MNVISSKEITDETQGQRERERHLCSLVSRERLGQEMTRTCAGRLKMNCDTRGRAGCGEVDVVNC